MKRHTCVSTGEKNVWVGWGNFEVIIYFRIKARTIEQKSIRIHVKSRFSVDITMAMRFFSESSMQPKMKTECTPLSCSPLTAHDKRNEEITELISEQTFRLGKTHK
jgi:hypothetical protein